MTKSTQTVTGERIPARGTEGLTINEIAFKAANRCSALFPHSFGLNSQDFQPIIARAIIEALDQPSHYEAQRDELLAAVKDMMHDLDIFYGKYREPGNKYIVNLKAVIARAEGRAE